jgi:hypothetical protein
MRTILFLAFSILGLAACSGGGGTAPPVSAATAPPTSVAVPPPVSAPPGQVLVTVAAASTPPGATVTGGGQVLGTTPFTTQVPVPAPSPGETQTFQFTFTLPGFTATTITASPVNNTISLNAVLASATPAVTGVPTGVGVPPTTPGGGPMRVHGVGGGRIYDYHSTTAQATVPSPCVIRTLSVDLGGNHTFNRDLVVSMRGPDGTSYSLQRHSSRSPFRTISVPRARGHLAMGVWTLAVEDTVGADSGMLTSFDMILDCM